MRQMKTDRRWEDYWTLVGGEMAHYRRVAHAGIDDVHDHFESDFTHLGIALDKCVAKANCRGAIPPRTGMF